MDMTALLARLDHLELQQLVWLAPLAFAAHVLEELPSFTTWVNRHIHPGFTRGDYLAVHLGGLGAGVLIAALLSVCAPPWLVFLYFALIVMPGYGCNVLFHLGATLYYRSYSPGLVTALVLYPPLLALLLRAALRQGLLTSGSAVTAFAIAALVHVLEVGRNTFGVDVLKIPLPRRAPLAD